MWTVSQTQTFALDILADYGQTGSPTIPQLLGIDQTLWHASGSVYSQVGLDFDHDSGTTSRRCFQLRYVPD